MNTFEQPYGPDDLLPLSGIQHFSFCRRQWALIHIEGQWLENRLTAEGRRMHDRADDPFLAEVREGIIRSRAVPVASYRLGLSGICDVVEFTPADDGIVLAGKTGRYHVAPVEYKRGKAKWDHSDEVQLCAQAICLEEMLAADIPIAYLYYGQTRRRVEVVLTNDLRRLVEKMAAEMHHYYQRGYTPKVKRTTACRSCSLNSICLPELEQQSQTASAYIEKWINGE